MPSGQVVAAVTLDVASELTDAVALLQDGCYATIAFDGQPIHGFLWSLASSRLLGDAEDGLLSERHQIAFASLGDRRAMNPQARLLGPLNE